MSAAAPADSRLPPHVERHVRSAAHLRRCCEIVRDAAGALEYAHSAGVVHRDLKPGNLMLERGGAVRVIDFGIARFFEDATLTRSGQLVGTPLYMSPEQVTGRVGLDHRTDVYSLGLVLYELLTLRPPFAADTREALLRQVVAKALPPVWSWNPAVPPALADVVHQAAARDCDDRYQSAGGLAEDLQRFLDGRAVAARRYRYGIDDREIAAARPTSVVLAVLAWLAVVAFYAERLVTTGYRLGRLSLPEYAVLVLVFVGIPTAAWGVLTGRGWAKWSALAGASYVTAVAAAVIAASAPAMFSDAQWSRVTADTLPSLYMNAVFMLAASLGTLYGLLNRRAREWFRLARDLRAESRRHRRRATVARD